MTDNDVMQTIDALGHTSVVWNSRIGPYAGIRASLPQLDRMHREGRLDRETFRDRDGEIITVYWPPQYPTVPLMSPACTREAYPGHGK